MSTKPHGMPPRRSLRHQHAASDPSLGSPPSAARAVYNMVELRQIILRLLDPPDLAMMMRVEKKGMFMVAQELYGVVTHEFACQMKRDTRKYTAAVVEINANDGHLSPAASAALRHRGPLLPDGHEVRRLATLTLRNRFANLRRVTYGADAYDRYGEWWTVHHFDPADGNRVLSAARPPTSADYGAQHVETFHSHLCDVEDLPPTTLDLSSVYADGRTVTTRFDLCLTRRTYHTPASSLIDAWLAAVRSEAMGSVYRAADFGILPISLYDLMDIYILQERRQYVVRLEHIMALHAEPFHLGAFLQFAEIACWAVTSLLLTLSGPDGYKEDAVGMSFEDFDEASQHIIFYMPNLRLLSMALKGIETAEAYCATQLRANILANPGTLEGLYIVTADFKTPLFNVIRLMANLLKKATFTTLHIGTARGAWGRATQQAVLSYLRNQSPDRRQHLETADFGALDVTEPYQLFELSYHEDGRPIRRRESKAAYWRAKIKQEGDLLLLSLAALRQATADVNSAAAALQEAVAGDAQEWRTANERLSGALNQQRVCALAVREDEARAEKSGREMSMYIHDLP